MLLLKRLHSFCVNKWTSYSLPPLYKFSYTNLEEYPKLLRSFIAAGKLEGLAVEVGEDFNIEVIFLYSPRNERYAERP